MARLQPSAIVKITVILYDRALSYWVELDGCNFDLIVIETSNTQQTNNTRTTNTFKRILFLNKF